MEVPEKSIDADEALPHGLTFLELFVSRALAVTTSEKGPNGVEMVAPTQGINRRNF